MPVPLATLRQPTREIGAAAFAAMLERVARPGAPARDILLQTELIVRKSCGGVARYLGRDAGRGRGPVPLDGALQPVLEGYSRLVAQEPACFGNVRL